MKEGIENMKRVHAALMMKRKSNKRNRTHRSAHFTICKISQTRRENVYVCVRARRKKERKKEEEEEEKI
jgi:hypothetical protein